MEGRAGGGGRGSGSGGASFFFAPSLLLLLFFSFTLLAVAALVVPLRDGPPPAPGHHLKVPLLRVRPQHQPRAAARHAHRKLPYLGRVVAAHLLLVGVEAEALSQVATAAVAEAVERQLEADDEDALGGEPGRALAERVLAELLVAGALARVVVGRVVEVVCSSGGEGRHF